MDRARPQADPDIERRFEQLAERWRAETEFHSAPTALFGHPAYREIVGLGPAVVPLLLADLADLADTGGMWFWALREITGENPVPSTERGDVARMTARWIEWGRARSLG